MRNKMASLVGIVLLIVGFVLVGISLAYSPMVTAIIDTSPPILMTQPSSGQTYSTLTLFSMRATDWESGIDENSAYFQLDGGSWQRMLPTGVSPDHPHVINFEQSVGTLSAGQHTFGFKAKNQNGLETSVTGMFSIYSALEGKWYINDIEIVDPTQIIRLTTMTLDFKFVKTKGVEDKSITCTVEWSGPTSDGITLTNTARSTWTGSHTFTKGGEYSITLKASDGTNSVIMNVFGLQLPTTEVDMKLPMAIGGVVMIGIGLTIVIKKHGLVG